MEYIIIDNISLMLLIPLWIFLIIMCGRFFSVYVNEKIIYVLTLISSAFGIFTCAASLIHLKSSIDLMYPFIKISDYTINIGLYADKISLILALLLFIVSFAVQLYSINNLKNEKKKYRFFALLNLFNFGMGTLLFSPNLLQMYVFWELVGVVSYLLIGFEYSNPIKSKASRRVFLINRFGDTALIGGIILTQYFIYSYAQNLNFVTLSFEDMNIISTLVLAYASHPMFIIICILFIIGAAVKSAQLPFYTWLQDAMEARTPVSALLHSSTLVVLGVFLIIRLMPFFTLSQNLMTFILVIGLLTAIVCSILASVETHPKKILAYSTSANLGLMFMALGLVNVRSAIILLLAHAFIKSMLFLLIPKDKQISYLSAMLMTVGVLSLGGLMLSEVGAKEILFITLEANRILNYAFLFIVFISAYYITRFMFLVMNKCTYEKKFGLIEISSLILLLFNIALYMFLRGTYQISEPVVAALGGLTTAILLYKQNALEKFSKTPNIAEKINNIYIPYIYQKLSIILYKLETNLFENYNPIIIISKYFVKSFNWVEENIMNGTVKLVADTSKLLSEADKRIQSRNVQNYNAYGFIIIAVIITLVIISYTFILGQME